MRARDDGTDKNDFHAGTMGNYGDNHLRARARALGHLFLDFPVSARIFEKVTRHWSSEGGESAGPAEAASRDREAG